MKFQPILSIIFLQQFRHSQHKQQMQQCLLRQQVIKSKIESFINNTTVIKSVQVITFYTRLHGMGSAWSRYEIGWHEKEFSF